MAAAFGARLSCRCRPQETRAQPCFRANGQRSSLSHQRWQTFVRRCGSREAGGLMRCGRSVGSEPARLTAPLEYLDLHFEPPVRLWWPLSFCARTKHDSDGKIAIVEEEFQTASPKVKFARRGSNVARASSALSPEVVAGLTKSFRAP